MRSWQASCHLAGVVVVTGCSQRAPPRRPRPRFPGPLLGGVAHAVDAPGRIHFTAFKGAVVLYLNAATIFATAFSLIWELNPGAFASLQPRQ